MHAAGPWQATLRDRINLPSVAGDAASLQPVLSVVAGLVLGLMATATWQAAVEGPLAAAGALAFVMGTCAVAALLLLRSRAQGAPAADEERTAQNRSDQLMAQMHHELRTPLNAMIGFSEVMLRELHGPLGHARYQEYAAHISESGGRLLRASEDALAVAATMSALLADRRALQRDRLPAAALVQEAWAALATPARDVRLRTEDCAAIEVECDRQATSQALQHLLDEAAGRVTPGGAITARASCRGGARHIEILAANPLQRSQSPDRQGSGLRIMLARSLIEMQGATLSVDTVSDAAAWSARIAFPLAAEGCAQSPQSVSAWSRRPASQARRGDFVAAAAARASAGSHAAPPT